MLFNFLEEEPLDKLISSFIELQQQENNYQIRKQRQLTLLNSILVGVTTKAKGLGNVFKQINYVLQVNSNDKTCLRRSATLLNQLVRRSQALLQTQPSTIAQILDFSYPKCLITVCGNEFITLIDSIVTKLTALTTISIQNFGQSLLQFMVSVKLQINTYRQEIRLCLYRILLAGLSVWHAVPLQWQNQNTLFLIQRCVRVGQGQKDPRNIQYVFDVYIAIMNIFSQTDLSQYRSSMFENIEAYYPIEFVGDQDNPEHKSIDLLLISHKLDQCLCHPFMAEQTWQLLSTKTAAPPISKFTNTFITYLKSIGGPRKQQFSSRCRNLLSRFSQQEYLGQSYEDGASDLGQVITAILDFIFNQDDGCFNYQAYSAIQEWIKSIMSRAMDAQCKYFGTIIAIFRTIINQSDVPRFATLIQMIRNYALRTLLMNISQIDDSGLLSKLGLTIVCLSRLSSPSLNTQELMNLLTLKVGTIYPDLPSQLKMLVLKILMSINEACPQNKSMIRQVNDCFILKDCLQRAKQAFISDTAPDQVYLVKAFIDFVSVIYLNQTKILLEQVQGVSFQLQTYLLSRLLEQFSESKQQNSNEKSALAQNLSKKAAIYQKYELLLVKIKSKQEVEAISKGIKILRAAQIAELINNISWKINGNGHLLFKLLLTLRTHLVQYSDQINQKTKNLSSKNQIVRNFIYNINNQNTQISVQEVLWRSLTCQQDLIKFPTLQQAASLPTLTLAFDPAYSEAYPSTYLQLYWERLKNEQPNVRRNQLLAQMLPYIPEKLLIRDSNQILPLLLTETGLLSSLNKVVKQLSVNSLEQNGVLQFCTEYLLTLQNDKQRQKVTQKGMNALRILIEALERDDKQTVKKCLIKRQKSLKKLLLHRKRPIRHGARCLMALLQP